MYGVSLWMICFCKSFLLLKISLHPDAISQVLPFRTESVRQKFKLNPRNGPRSSSKLMEGRSPPGRIAPVSIKISAVHGLLHACISRFVETNFPDVIRPEYSSPNSGMKFFPFHFELASSS